MTSRRKETVEEWLSALEGMGRQVVRHHNYAMAQCPAHDDSNPSMQVKDRGDGTASVECYAGCEFTAILQAVGFYGTGGNKTPENVPSTPPRARQREAKEPPKPRALPNGKGDTPYVYHDSDGGIAFAVVRYDRPNRPKSFSQWTPVQEAGKEGLWLPVAPASNRPMYFLPDVLRTAGVVGIVEGEKCAHALRDAQPSKPVTTWAGGTNAWQLTDWTPLAGRDVALIADGDAPGHKAALALAAHLHGLGCKVKLALPPPEWDSDIADWLAVGKAHAQKILADLLRDYPSDVDDLGKSGHENGQSVSKSDVDDLDVSPDGIRDNSHYRLMGLRGTDFIFFLKRSSQEYTVSRTHIYREDEIYSIAPDYAFWSNLTQTDSLTKDIRFAIGRSITVEADNLGQYDPNQTAGRGAVRLADGKVAYHLGDRVLVGHTEAALNDYGERVWLAGARLDLGSPATKAQVRDIAKAVMRYRWASEDDGRRFLGWIVSAVVGGALEWRPHLWLTAPAGTGKTWLFDQVLLKLMGNAMMPLADVTAASLARLTGNSSLPIGIDEAEPSRQWLESLLPLLRVASSGTGARVRADAHGGVNVSHSRFSALLSSTVTPNLSKADASRMTMVGLSSESVDDWPSVRRGVVNALRHADAARYKMIREAQAIADAAGRLSIEMQDVGVDTRDAMSRAALTAGWRWWGLDDREVLAQPERSEGTDAQDALLEILGLRYNAPGGHTYSVAEMLTDTVHERALLDLYGIRRVGDELWLAEKHQGLRTAMRNSKWASADLRQLLRQMDGVTTTPTAKRFGALRTRAIVVPPETLEAAGVDLGAFTASEE